MKFSEIWLREYVKPALTGEAFSHRLSMAGLEVEEEISAAPFFENVVVAEVLSVEKHPDADKLKLCQVKTSATDTRQIVCGAPNVTSGVKVPCALPGAVLPGGMAIKTAKVRGIESSGMLCSAKELGVAEDASGLLILPKEAPVGTNIRDYLNLDDTIRTLKLTPNRADCLSLFGIAREVAALFEVPATFPETSKVPVTSDAKRNIRLDASEACPRYCGRVIESVDARAKTPAWMVERLERSGVRAISALVDITNYVMLEMGQPLHAFDHAKLEGDICVRMAKEGEELLLLNEKTLPLASDVLVISDARAPIAMAGIMGGEGTGISLDTTSLFLESAFFAPKAIAGRARRYGFSSDASYRFERGVDFAACEAVLERASALVLEICGGRSGPITHAEVPEALPKRLPVRLRPTRLSKVLGLAFDDKAIASFLTRLNLSFVMEEGVFIVTPPSYRFDMEIEEDLIEEVARLYGYDNIPVAPPKAALSMLPVTEATRPLSVIRRHLLTRGFSEVINFAFVDEAWEQDFAENPNPIRLANPIVSTMNVMRSSLIGGLLGNVHTNLKRKEARVRIFETGRVFVKDEKGAPVAGFSQEWHLAALSYGDALPEQWGASARPFDFYDAKGEVEALFAPATLQFEKLVHPAFHPGRSARVLLDGKPVGLVGELHPKWQQKYELPAAPVLFELSLEALKRAHLPRYQDLVQTPSVVRDLAILVDQTLPLQDVLNALFAKAPELVTDIRLFDVYDGKGISDGKKSLAFRIVMQDTRRTLQEAEVEAVVQTLIAHLETTFSAQLRTV